MDRHIEEAATCGDPIHHTTPFLVSTSKNIYISTPGNDGEMHEMRHAFHDGVKHSDDSFHDNGAMANVIILSRTLG